MGCAVSSTVAIAGAGRPSAASSAAGDDDQLSRGEPGHPHVLGEHPHSTLLSSSCNRCGLASA